MQSEQELSVGFFPLGKTAVLTVDVCNAVS